MSRKFFVGGNWKCNGGVDAVAKLTAALSAAVPDLPQDVEVVVSPPLVYLESVRRTLHGYYGVAAQNSWTKKGAFTGEVAPEFLLELNIGWVILGHSERRHVLKESDELLVEKTKSALAAGLQVIFCVGELESERESGATNTVLERQMSFVARALPSAAEWSRVVVAYEPVWAIGTGKTASPAQAQDAHAFIRAWMAANAPGVADSVRILYGGSVTPQNANELAAQPDVDGFLVGGASLDAAKFVPIIQSAAQKK